MDVQNEMKQPMNAVGLTELGVDVSDFQDTGQTSPKERAEKANRDTTFLDFYRLLHEFQTE